MTEIICLANSWKHKERCIAGIDRLTGQWIRPVTDLDDGRVPRHIRLVSGDEPALLDILVIPLAATGPHNDFEVENRRILPGRWRRVGRVYPTDLFGYCSKQGAILHNSYSTVSLAYLRSLPFKQRQTLQLVETSTFEVQIDGQRDWGGNKWRGKLITPTGHCLTAPITDPVLVSRLDTGYRPSKHCLVTVSLGMPWPPGGNTCWKLIAAVIDLKQDHSFSRVTDEELMDVPF